MIKLQFLGTCAGVPSKERNVSSLVIQMLHYKDQCWLFDCGEATQHQLLYSSITLAKINRLFVTHLHGDHIFGIPGFLASRSFQGATTPFFVYGPKGIKNFIEISLQTSYTYLRYPLTIYEIDDEGIFEKNEHFSFEAIKLDHGVKCFGYRIKEKDVPGRLLVQKLNDLGIKAGPIYQKLKNGEVVTTDDGQILNGTDFVGPARLGKIIAIGGDTRKCDSLKRLAKDAHLLVHEATYTSSDEELAYEHYHSTALDAAKLANDCHVKALFLNHISSRYSKNVDQLFQEAKAMFQKCFIAHDLQTFIIQGDGTVIINNSPNN